MRQRLENQRRIEPTETGTADIFSNINTGEAKLACRADHICRKMTGFVPLDGFRRKLVVRKGERHLADNALFFRQFEFHWLSSFSRLENSAHGRNDEFGAFFDA